MENIKFIGRSEELGKLRNIKGSFFLVVKGRRRIGKTMLLRKAFPNATYIFVWPDKSIGWLCEQICRDNSLPAFRNFKDILEYLLDKDKIIIIDEFQNLINIDKSVYGEIQKIIDERKIKNQHFKIAVAGSSYSLMNKVFNDSASPLYGRRTDEIHLDNLQLKDLFSEIGFSFEEFIKLWTVFEGVPYYYELISKKLSAEKNIKGLVVLRDAQLKEEGKTVLSVEFGKDSKTYNTILSAIAEGKTKLNEISSLFSNKKNEVIKYLDILRKDFRLVKKVTPITENPDKSHEGRYEIIDNFLSFWFVFIDSCRSLFEQERFEEVEKSFDMHFNSYVGRKFEKLVILLLKNKTLLGELDFEKIGRQWGKFDGEKGRNVYEIDVLALNELKKEILFGECKWQDKVNAVKVIKECSEKSKHVRWNSGNRKESFAVFAKSFAKRINKFEGRIVYCFDLNDIKKALRNKKYREA